MLGPQLATLSHSYTLAFFFFFFTASVLFFFGFLEVCLKNLWNIIESTLPALYALCFWAARWRSLHALPWPILAPGLASHCCHSHTVWPVPPHNLFHSAEFPRRHAFKWNSSVVLSGISGQGCVRGGLTWTDHGHTEVTFWLTRMTVVADGCQESSAVPRQRQRGSYIKDGNPCCVSWREGNRSVFTEGLRCSWGPWEKGHCVTFTSYVGPCF